MANFIHASEYLSGGDTVIVDCSHQCNVMVMTNTNFQHYRTGRKFSYFGGHYKRLPAQISVPHEDTWNIVIDLGGGRANIKYNISYIKG